MDDQEWERWLPTTSSSMPTLNVLDDRCRCNVCKDYLHGPMMTLCGHTFCSLCIRRALNADGRCPSCRSLEEESKLRKNLMIEEIVEAFLPFRESLMKYAQATDVAPARVPSSSQDDLEVDLDGDDGLESKTGNYESKPTSPAYSRARVTRASRNRDQASPQIGNLRHEESPAPGHISCPICQRHIHQDKADLHVNRCIEGKASPPSSPGAISTNRGSNSPYFTESTIEPHSRASRLSSNKTDAVQPLGQQQEMKRLAKISYAVMNDGKLRKTMAELGISTVGNRTQLQRRCTEFIAMWNSNLDSRRPKSRKDLLNDMKAWDRVQARPITKSTNDEIDSANQKGLFDDTFADLVSKARESLKKRKAVEVVEADKTPGTSDVKGHEAKRQQT